MQARDTEGMSDALRDEHRNPAGEPASSPQTAGIWYGSAVVRHDLTSLAVRYDLMHLHCGPALFGTEEK